MKVKYKKLNSFMKKELDNNLYISPKEYKKIFKEYSKKLNIKYDDLTKEEINSNITENANELEVNINNAIKGINNHDTDFLKETLIKTEFKTELLKEKIKKLKEQIYTDPLTKAHNRKWFSDNYLKNNHEKMSKNGKMVFIDLNDFKLINDNYGHATGDITLCYIVSLLKKSLKESNCEIVRFGGDEFIILFQEDCLLKNIKKNLNNIQKILISKKYKFRKNEFKISFSFGCIEFYENDDLVNLLDKADLLVNQNKKLIKNNLNYQIR